MGIEEDVARLLPAGPPPNESQQVGRSRARDAAETQVRAGAVLVLAEPRRVGKTGFCRAILDRVVTEGGVAAEVNLALTPDPALAAEQVAEQLARGLGAAGVAARRIVERVQASLSRIDSDVDAVGRAAQFLLGPKPSLATVLAQAPALVSDRRAVVFVDEAHVIGGWPPLLQAELCQVLRNNTALGLLIASSERRAFEQLIGDGGALEFGGRRFRLPDIRPIEWREGLSARFAALGLAVDDDALAELIELSACHPLKTMLLAQYAALAALGDAPDDHGQHRLRMSNVLNALFQARTTEEWKRL